MYPIEIAWHGRVDYQTAWDWQKRLVAERKVDPALPGKLLLLEHPPTYTLGRSGRLENLLYSEADMAGQGICLHRVDRGGDITYHGPGQLVGYPILNLHQVYNGFGLGRVRQYVADLEEALVRTVAHFGLTGRCHPKHRGVWLETAAGLCKTAAIGVRISGGISSHGFALNVNPNLEHFAGIIPCGIKELGVTSLSAELGREVTCEEVLPVLQTAFQAVFVDQSPEARQAAEYCRVTSPSQVSQ